MSPTGRRFLGIAVLILGTVTSVVLAWELATAGYWRIFWVLLSVIFVSSGVTILVSELRAAQLAASREHFTARLAEVRADIHAQRAEVRVLFDEIQDHRDETRDVHQSVLRLGFHAAHTLPVGRATVVSQTVVRAQREVDTGPVEVPEVKAVESPDETDGLTPEMVEIARRTTKRLRGSS